MHRKRKFILNYEIIYDYPALIFNVFYLEKGKTSLFSSVGRLWQNDFLRSMFTFTEVSHLRTDYEKLDYCYV